MPLPIAAIELGLSITLTLVKLGGRIDRIMAGEAASRSPLAFPAEVSVEPPPVADMTDLLSGFLVREEDNPEATLSAADRAAITQAIEDPDRVEATLLPVMERFIPEEIRFQVIDHDNWARGALEVLREEGFAPMESEQATVELLYYLGPGADRREQSLPWQIGMAVFAALAEFALQNQERFVREEGTRKLIGAVLQRLATPDLLEVADGRALIRHVLKATLNGAVDVHEAIDGDNPLLEAVFEALADAREAQPEDQRNDYLIGLVRGKGYKAFIAELIEEGAERLGEAEAPAYRRVIADVLQEASNKVQALPSGAGFADFFDDHWADLARAGLRSLEKHGPIILDDTTPILREVLLAAVGSLAETPGRTLLTSDALISATEAAIAAVAAKPELLGSGELGSWARVFYGSFADIVADSGLRRTFSAAGVTRIAQGAAGRLADQPQLLIQDAGLSQAIVGGILKKLAGAPSIGLETLAMAAIDGALTAVSENPALLKRDDGEAMIFAEVAADIAGRIAARVRDRSLTEIQGADILDAAIGAIASNAALFTELQSGLANLVIDQVLEAARRDEKNLLTATAVVSLIDSVLQVVAQRGLPLLGDDSAAALAVRINAVVAVGLDTAGQELGRQLDLPAVPLVVAALVDAWARGEAADLDRDDPAFQALFAQLADQATRPAA